MTTGSPVRTAAASTLVWSLLYWADEVLRHEGDGLLFGGLQEQQCEQELVPRVDEDQHHDRGDDRPRERQQHMPERSEHAGPVDPSGLDQRIRPVYVGQWGRDSAASAKRGPPSAELRPGVRSVRS
jgi:hypothetical protein